MGSRCKKAIIAESVRESLHSWCKRVKARSKATNSITTRSTCSLESIIDEGDEIITVGSATLSPSSSFGHTDDELNHDQDCDLESSSISQQLDGHEFSFRHNNDDDRDEVVEARTETTLLDLLNKTYSTEPTGGGFRS